MSSQVLRRPGWRTSAPAPLDNAESAAAPSTDDRRYKVLTTRHAPAQLPLFAPIATRGPVRR